VLPPSGAISGAVLSDQVKSLDWGVRRIAFEAKAPESVINEVRERLRVLLGL
jgi:mRNA interferase MazF